MLDFGYHRKLETNDPHIYQPHPPQKLRFTDLLSHHLHCSLIHSFCPSMTKTSLLFAIILTSVDDPRWLHYTPLRNLIPTLPFFGAIRCLQRLCHVRRCFSTSSLLLQKLLLYRLSNSTVFQTLEFKP